MPDFSHLHCHTQYSLLDGAAGIDNLIESAERRDIPAVAITDHGNLYGVPEFYTTAKDSAVQPIIGCEFYLTPSGIQDQSDSTRYHQVLLAKNQTGYENLMQLSSTSFLEGFYYKPRIDLDLLREHHEGLVATTCCLQGQVPQAILNKGEERARELFETYLDIFGDDYYIEIQDHDIDDQQTINEVLLTWAREYDVEVLATNDVHYVDQQDHEAQDILLCLQTGDDYNDPDRMRFSNDEFYLKGEEEMTEALTGIPKEFQREALVNTNEVAAKCKFDLPMGDLLMPHYPIPDGFEDMDEYLRHVTFKRAKTRYGDPLPQNVVDRLNHELGIIADEGYSGYFLIVQDFTDAARELDVRVGPGRGSAAGSCVSYCLGITDVDPIEYDLLFERFLNPERVSMPDIDIDFDDRGRERVIDYVVEKYGQENVCQIITFGTMGAKTVVRDVSRVLDIPLDRADEIAKMIPDGPGVDLDQAFEENPEFRSLKQADNPEVQKMMQYAEVLEGSVRHTGVHAAGVIIAPGEISDYVPVSVAKSKGEKVVTTQYDGDWVEEFGLLKMDFLGLKTLTLIEDTVDLVEDTRGDEVDIDNIPLDDETTFELFQRGDTVSIFQFESAGMREHLRKLKPTEINDLIAMNALYRPGPMENIPTYIARKHGREEVEYPHPMLEDILEPTYGIPVYQEQVMQIAREMGGFSLGKADILRRCVPGNTRVVDAETGQRRRVDSIEPGTSILTLDDEYELTETTVAERFENGTKPVYRVKTRSGRTIELTENHPLRTVEGWEHLSDLSEGDEIAVPASLPVSGTDSPSSARIRILAYLLGDGQTMDDRGHAVARFYNSDPYVLADYREAVNEFGGQTSTYDHPTSDVKTVTARGSKEGENPITDLVRSAGIVGRAEEKHLPREVFRYDSESLAHFLGTLFSTDGSVEKARISYSSSSPALIDDLAHALLRLGVATVRRHRATTHQDNIELIVTDQRDIVKFAEVIGPHLCPRKKEALDVLHEDALDRSRNQSIYNLPADVTHEVRRAKHESGRTWREGGEEVGIPGSNLSSGLNFTNPKHKLSRHRLEALGQAFDSTELVNLSNGEILWDPIVDIEYVGEKEVYDLAVPPHSNFVASDVVIHNSMGKKKEKIMNQMKGEFVEGAQERGVDEDTIEHVWELMAKFAGYGFNKCVVGDTEIIDADTGRPVQVQDIVEGRETDVSVASLDEETQELVTRDVVDAFSNGERQTYRLTTRTGHTIRATANHPVYTPDGWTYLGELEEEDRVAVPRSVPYEPSHSMDEHELVVLGYAISEGNLCHPSGFYVYTKSDEELRDYCEHLRRFENSDVTIDRSKSATSIYAKRENVNEPSAAVQFIEDLGLKGLTATEKHIPDAAFQLPKEQLSILLGRLWTGDGCIDADRQQVFYATSSEELAQDVQHLLTRLELPSTIHEKSFKYRDGERPGYIIRVSNKVLDRFAEAIGPHLVGDAARSLDVLLASNVGDGRMTQDVIPSSIRPMLRKAVQGTAEARGTSMAAVMRTADCSPKLLQKNGDKKGYARETVGAVAAETESDALDQWATSDLYWDEVASIEDTGVEEVYDLTVEGTHNFVANDLVVHNSHSAAYSLVAYRTAYLKAHYPPEFMAAAMTNEMDNTDKLSKVLEEARSMGLEVLPPSINRSQAHFTVEQPRQQSGEYKVRFGLAAIKNAGEKAIDALIEAREEHGPFESIFDLTKNVDLGTVNKRTLEALAQAGALDDLEGHRAQLMEIMDKAVRYGQKVQHDRAAGQNSLFGNGDAGTEVMQPGLPDVEPWPESKRLKAEHEVLGFYVSGHPLDEFRAEADAFATAHFGAPDQLEKVIEQSRQPSGDGRNRGPVRTFCGIITDVDRNTTRSGKPIAFATIEDFTGQGEMVVFSSILDRVQPYLEVDNVVLAKGNVEVRGGTVKVLAKDITPMWKVREQMVSEVVLTVDLDQVRPDELQTFQRLCQNTEGNCTLYFDVDAPELRGRERLRSRAYVIEPTAEFMRGAQRIFGADNIALKGN